MEPTLYTNNVLIVERITQVHGKLARGDIVVAKNPTDPKTKICKRVVGMPGDQIILKPRINWNPFKESIKDSRSTVVENGVFKHYRDVDDFNDDGRTVSNRDLAQRTFNSANITVPRGHVWLEGDNYQASADSRIYGPVPLGLVSSRVVCRLWPLHEAKCFI